MMRSHRRMPMQQHQPVEHDEDGDISPEQLLSGIALLVGFALATGLLYALIDALL